MAQLFVNDFEVKLGASLTDSATSLTVESGKGALVPVIANPDTMKLCIENAASQIEIVTVTAHTAGSDVFTITRGAESTTARAFVAGDIVRCGVTAGDLDGLADRIAALEDDIGGVAAAPVLAKSANYTALLADSGAVLSCTNTITIALTAAATLGDGWRIYIRNSGTGVVTINPNASETINGALTKTLGPGEAAFVACNGTLFYALFTNQSGLVLLYDGADATTHAMTSVMDSARFKDYEIEVVSQNSGTGVWSAFTLSASTDNGSTYVSSGIRLQQWNSTSGATASTITATSVTLGQASTSGSGSSRCRYTIKCDALGEWLASGWAQSQNSGGTITGFTEQAGGSFGGTINAYRVVFTAPGSSPTNRVRLYGRTY